MFVVAEAAFQSEGKISHNAAGSVVNIFWTESVETLCKYWLCFVCAGVVNSLLSFRALFPLSRLTYCAYLLHPLVMVVTAFSMDGPLHIHNFNIILHLCLGLPRDLFLPGFSIRIPYSFCRLCLPHARPSFPFQTMLRDYLVKNVLYSNEEFLSTGHKDVEI